MSQPSVRFLRTMKVLGVLGLVGVAGACVLITVGWLTPILMSFKDTLPLAAHSAHARTDVVFLALHGFTMVSTPLSCSRATYVQDRS